MQNAATIGLDLAKQVFQVHGTDAEGNTLFNRKLRRLEVKDFFQKLPPCTVVMEACGSAYHWAREIAALGHEAKIIPAQHVTPFVKRSKTDAGDAVAISEAAKRKGIRFVPIKTKGQQAAGMLLRTRTLLVRQRAGVINSVRSHLSELGLVAEKGTTNAGKLINAFRTGGVDVPDVARFAINELVDEIDALTVRIERLDRELARQAKEDEDLRRLMTVPGIGILTAATIKAHVADPGSFKSSRGFSAWLGLTPKQNSSGGKVRFGKISKMGDVEIRSLLYVGATSIIAGARRTGFYPHWLLGLLQRRPHKVVVVALANKLARIVWALLTKGGEYQQVGMKVAAPDGAKV
ncbi:IS110 family transposase [Rhizobium sp. ZK1]|uniref:IS110 family transposase n=1 Tax=Rhizobium sp. ZK1 TaxID=3389872 RepID=UPI0039F676D1